MSGTATIPVWNWSALEYLNIVVLRGAEPDGLPRKPSPDIVTDLVNRGGRVHMRCGAGDAVSFPDTAFSDVVFVATRAALVADADVVMANQSPAPDMVDQMKEGAILICPSDSSLDHVLIQHLLERKITCFAVAGAQFGKDARTLCCQAQADLLALIRKGNTLWLDWKDKMLVQAAITHAGKRTNGLSTIGQEHVEPHERCRDVTSASMVRVA